MVYKIVKVRMTDGRDEYRINLRKRFLFWNYWSDWCENGSWWTTEFEAEKAFRNWALSRCKSKEEKIFEFTCPSCNQAKTLK